MAEKTYPAGQYVAGESLELGDYLLTAVDEIQGSVEMYEDYDHFTEAESFRYDTFRGEYRMVLRKKGVVVVIEDVTCTRIQTESDEK